MAERVLRGRGEPAAEATRAIEDTRRPSAVRTRPASGLMPSIASTGCAEAASDGRFEFVCFRVGVATVVEPISMPPPESGPSEPSLTATGDTATGADPVGDSGGGGGVGA